MNEKKKKKKKKLGVGLCGTIIGGKKKSSDVLDRRKN